VYRFSPGAAIKWQPLAKGLYFTSCLTQCFFLSPGTILTAGTDGHTAIWPLNQDIHQLSTDCSDTVSILEWEQPLRIHQSSSKAMASVHTDASHQLLVSGGDDGSLAVLLMRRETDTVYAAPPVLLQRAHASAVTACAIIRHDGRTLILTTGNDQWLRLWEVTLRKEEVITTQTTLVHGGYALDISRLGKIKTNVADASSMAVLDTKESDARVLICGVGMEVVRVDWQDAA
jgi:WD40 repeat protein